MGDLTDRLIETLKAGGAAADDVLPTVGELLRKAWHPGFVPFGEEVQVESVTSEEVERLRNALAAYSRNEPDTSKRRGALSILAKEGRPELREQLADELHAALRTYRIIGKELFQLLLALEDVGVKVFPERGLRSLTAVESNANAAGAYLATIGISVSWE